MNGWLKKYAFLKLLSPVLFHSVEQECSPFILEIPKDRCFYLSHSRGNNWIWLFSNNSSSSHLNTFTIHSFGLQGGAAIYYDSRVLNVKYMYTTPHQSTGTLIPVFPVLVFPICGGFGVEWVGASREAWWSCATVQKLNQLFWRHQFF